MGPDWTRLAPHRPLDPGDEHYVPRPDGLADRVQSMLDVGQSPVLVAGPVGIGKSTELARVALLLKQRGWVVFLVRLDRFENIRKLTAKRVWLRAAGLLVESAIRQSKLEISEGLRNLLASQGVLSEDLRAGGAWVERSPRDIAVAAVREIQRLSNTKRIAIVVDGIEKSPEGPAQEAFEALGALQGEADLVVAAPWHATFGLAAEGVMAPAEKLVVIRPLDTANSMSPGAIFLRNVLGARLGISSSESIPDGARPLIDRAIAFCGGVPRTFLQLMADAAGWARRRSRDWPGPEDLDEAIGELRESFRRLLLPKDDEELKKVDGTDGREMERARKIRLLNHGILLETEEKGEPVMRPHPIVKASLLRSFYLV